jgi:hypothetical protein
VIGDGQPRRTEQHDLGNRGRVPGEPSALSTPAAAHPTSRARDRGPATTTHGVLTRDLPGAICRRSRNGAVQQEDANNAREGRTMSNHFGARRAQAPRDDPRLDLTAPFVFASAQTPSKTALIFDVNAFVTGADFGPETVQRLKTPGEPAG